MLIPWYYRALVVLLLFGGIFGLGYWRGDRHGAKELGACEARVTAATAAQVEQGKRLDGLNETLKAIAAKQQEAVDSAKDAADAARAAGRGVQAQAHALPGIDCSTTAKAARGLAPTLNAQRRGK